MLKGNFDTENAHKLLITVTLINLHVIIYNKI